MIKDKAPSEYMAKFKHDNKNLEKTMQSHLIEINTFGIWTDDYSLFFKNRVKKIQEELRDRLIIKPYDKE